MGALGAAQPQKSVREDAAFEKRVGLLFDKVGQARPGPRLDLGKEALGVFLDQLIQGGFFRARSLVVDGLAVGARWSAWPMICIAILMTVFMYGLSI